MDLDRLKELGEAPDFLNLEGLVTLEGGYLLENETPLDAYKRLANTAAKQLKKPELEDKFFNMLWKGWLCVSTPVFSNFGAKRGLPISCVTGDSWIVTKTGGKQAKDIEIGDLVLSHTGKFRPVSNIIATDNRSNIYKLKISNRMTPIHITENHTVLTNLGWVRVDELNPEIHLVAINGDIEYTETLYSINLTQFVPYNYKIVEGRIVKPLSGISDKVLKQNGGRTFNNYYSKPFSTVTVDEDLAWAFGLWFAEGSVSINNKKTPNGIKITLNKDEEDLAKRWLNVITSKFGLNGNINYYKGRKEGSSGWICVNVNGGVIGNLFKSFGQGCKEKTLPDWALDLPLSYTQRLLDGLLVGDGSLRSSGDVKLTLSNPKLLLQAYQLGLKLGHPMSLQMQDKVNHLATTSHVYTIVFRKYKLSVNKHTGSSAIKFNDGLYYSPIKELILTDKIETVYDFTVDVDHSFSVAGVVVHNCYGSYIPDSTDGIFKAVHEIAMLSKNGGGCSCTLHSIRGRGENISGGGKSDGVVGWLKVIDQTIATVSQGCYDDKTEVLTENGWKLFENLTEDDLIADIADNETLSFQPYSDYIKYRFEGELVRFTNKVGSIDLAVTPNHNMVVKKRKQLSYKRNTEGKYISRTSYTSNYNFITADVFNPNRDNYIPISLVQDTPYSLSPIEQFFIAYQADGSSKPVGNSTGSLSKHLAYSFHFAKARKIKRFEEILIGAGLQYTKTTSDTTNFYVKVPIEVVLDKRLKTMFGMNLSKGKAEAIIDELQHWDGSSKSISGLSYSTTVKDNVDYIQYLSVLSGKQCSIPIRDADETRQILYTTYISTGNMIGGDSIVKTLEPYKGNVYCVTVPNHRLVVRSNGRVSICGNSTRRGAVASYLPIEHTDFDEFISIRRQTGDESRKCRSVGFHHGVTITDSFMEKLELGDVEARRRWESLLQTRLETGEPYIVWIDTVNNNKPASIKKDITHSNLCIAGSERVVTNKGYLTALELYEQAEPLTLFDGEKEVASSEMKLREESASLYKITLENGLEHKVTDYHELPVMDGEGNITKVSCKDLTLNDCIAIQINKGLFGPVSMEYEAFLLGLYQSDGTQYKDIRFIDVWENDFDLLDEIEFKVDAVYKKYGYNKYSTNKRIIESPKFTNCTVKISPTKKKRLQSNKFLQLDFNKGYVPFWIWESDEKTQWQYLRGLLYANGTVSQNNDNGSPIQVAYSDTNRDFLKELQLLFNNLGLQSSIKLSRKSGSILIPDGKEDHNYYETKDCYRLIVSNKNSALEVENNTQFLSRKGRVFKKDMYSDGIKKHYKITTIEYIGEEPVYCPTVASEEHIFVAQGFKTFNCSEIMLADDEEHTYVCCLSSLNLTKFDEWKDTDTVELSIYFLDAVIEEFIHKSKTIKGLDKARKFAKKSRALGLGVLGWHDLLQIKGLPFDSFESMQLNNQVFKHIAEQSKSATQKLALEYGEPEDCIDLGVRNSTLTAIAPTLSNSIISGVFSEGIQPIVSNIFAQKTSKGTFIRKNPLLVTLLEEKGKNTIDTWTQINTDRGSVKNLNFLSAEEKDMFKTAREINQFALIRQASQRQKYICQGQSLNLFFSTPQNLSDTEELDKLAKYVHNVHMEAWKLGVKSLYYFKSESSLKGESIYAEGSDCKSCEG